MFGTKSMRNVIKYTKCMKCTPISTTGISIRNITINSGLYQSNSNPSVNRIHIPFKSMSSTTGTGGTSNNTTPTSGTGYNNVDLPDLYPKKIEDILDMDKINQEHPIDFEKLNLVETKNQELENLKIIQQM